MSDWQIHCNLISGLSPLFHYPIRNSRPFQPFDHVKYHIFLAKRLQIELMSLMSDTDIAQAGISAFPDEDNLFRWVGTINGPQDSPYEGLILKLQLEFPETYPYKPPNCQFKVGFIIYE